MSDQNANEARIRKAADAVAEATDSDVLLLDGPMKYPLDFEIIDLCASMTRRANVFLVLVTEGGKADPAYRIARRLQEHYIEWHRTSIGGPTWLTKVGQHTGSSAIP